MKTNCFPNVRSTLTAALVMLLMAGSAAAQKSAKEQCSLAVVSREADSAQPVCDGVLVRETAKQGQAFELDQQGMASILALGPGYSQKEALKWFEQAAERGNAAAQVNLAVLHMNGWGTERNYGTALLWLQRAADQGFARAYYNLGLLYLQGQGVRQDYAEALRWFAKGANANDPSAEANLGYMYDEGLGCTRSATAAAAWYRKAAEAGSPLGENNLADMYLRGEGVPRDNAQAFSWFQKAALDGNTGARIKLGYMYAAGLGTPKNPEAAYTWITSATLAGDQRGQYLIPSIEALLTTQQIAEARERAQHLSFERGQQLSAAALTQ